jgi:hypothetical protein
MSRRFLLAALIRIRGMAVRNPVGSRATSELAVSPILGVSEPRIFSLG